MDENSLIRGERKVEKNEDPFARLRAQLKQAKAGGLVTSCVFLVLDESGSMESYCTGKSVSKADAVRNVVNDVLAEYPTTRFRIVGFSEDAQMRSDMTEYVTRGSTNIESGLRAIEPNSQTVLLSDGGETNGSARSVISSLLENKIVVNCIGVGVDHAGEWLLREVAEKTGGTYAGIDADMSQIFSTFKKLASKAVAALTAGGRNG